jgi:hypothetical protein
MVRDVRLLLLLLLLKVLQLLHLHLLLLPLRDRVQRGALHFDLARRDGRRPRVNFGVRRRVAEHQLAADARDARVQGRVR